MVWGWRGSTVVRTTVRSSDLLIVIVNQLGARCRKSRNSQVVEQITSSSCNLLSSLFFPSSSLLNLRPIKRSSYDGQNRANSAWTTSSTSIRYLDAETDRNKTCPVGPRPLLPASPSIGKPRLIYDFIRWIHNCVIGWTADIVRIPGACIVWQLTKSLCE